MTSNSLVGARESLVVTCDSLVVARYYSVRRCAFLCLCCFAFALFFYGHDLVVTSGNLVVTCDSLVVTSDYQDL